MSTITKEWLQQKISDMEENRDLFPGDLDDDHGKVLAALHMALASLEAEASGRNPVLAYADSYRDMANQGVESIPVWSVITDLERNIAPLFTAPPAPAFVPEHIKRNDADGWWMYKGHRVGGGCAEWYNRALDDCRAAMLQGADGTLTNEGTIQDGNSPVIHDGGNTTPPYQGWVVTHGGKDHFYRKQSDAVTHLNAAIESGDGASLIAVIAEPVTTANKLPFDQWLSQQTGTIDVECGCVMTEVFFHWLRVAYEAGNSPHCREILNSSTKNFRENAETSTKCWCRTCRPVTISDMRFVVCPDCGNKRCPHANDHRNACTGSNEPGQEGGAYPLAPQQEVK